MPQSGKFIIRLSEHDDVPPFFVTLVYRTILLLTPYIHRATMLTVPEVEDVLDSIRETSPFVLEDYDVVVEEA